MLNLFRPIFPHRHNANGTHDSFGTVCLVTVATVQYEWELARKESAHVCESIDLNRVNQDLSPWPRIAL
jgi:hypothetical protein